MFLFTGEKFTTAISFLVSELSSVGYLLFAFEIGSLRLSYSQFCRLLFAKISNSDYGNSKCFLVEFEAYGTFSSQF